MDKEPKKKRGLALLSPERRKEIASAGGKSVPKAKRAFSQNADLAALAGQKSKRRRAVAKLPKIPQATFTPNLPEDGEDLLVLRLRVSGAHFIVLQRKENFNLERGLQEAWFAMRACEVRPPMRWTLEVRNGSGALMMVLKNKL